MRIMQKIVLWVKCGVLWTSEILFAVKCAEEI